MYQGLMLETDFFQSSHHILFCWYFKLLQTMDMLRFENWPLVKHNHCLRRLKHDVRTFLSCAKPLRIHSKGQS